MGDMIWYFTLSMFIVWELINQNSSSFNSLWLDYECKMCIPFSLFNATFIIYFILMVDS